MYALVGLSAVGLLLGTAGRGEANASAPSAEPRRAISQTITRNDTRFFEPSERNVIDDEAHFEVDATLSSAGSVEVAVVVSSYHSMRLHEFKSSGYTCTVVTTVSAQSGAQPYSARFDLLPDDTGTLFVEFPASFTRVGTAVGPASCDGTPVGTLTGETRWNVFITARALRDDAGTITALDFESTTGIPPSDADSSMVITGHGVVDVVGDTDGDALLDAWERDGLDLDDDGTVDLDLPAMGADPMHKDIFLEIDYMSGHDLVQIAVDRVVAAFAAAPVANPDGVSGVTLHVDNGSFSTMNPLTGETWGALSDSDTLPHRGVLGAYTAPNVYDWSAFDAIKAANFSEARKRAFHYVVSGHRYGAAAEGSAGISRGIGASDLLVTLGPASEPGEGSGNVSQQAAVLMHELGHNLGLRHGGGDDTNYKPSYLSIMNYMFLWTGLPRTDGTFLLDYSRLRLPLDENDLDEDAGFGFPPASVPAQFRTAYVCPGDPRPPAGTPRPAPVAVGPVDWNCDGSPQGVVAADVNGDARISALTPFLDWPALVYEGGAIGAAAAALPQTTVDNEPELDELLAWEQVFKASLDTSPPNLTLPPDLTVDATSPAGATVSFSATASDDVGASPSVVCAPASGSVFPIGTATVTCTATDAAGNSASGSFSVRVRGAPEQIVRLIDRTLAYLGLPALEAALKTRLQAASDALIAKKKSLACSALKLYVAAVKAVPSPVLTAAQKAELAGDATRIRAVIGCP